MHNNYYFLRQLSNSLEKKLRDAVISECFSQNKDELIIRFELSQTSFYIKAHLLPELTCLSFPADFNRARKNSVDLFEPIIGCRVNEIEQFNNERSFSILCANDLQLLFKMHGNRSNVLLISQKKVTDLFKKNIKGDDEIQVGNLHRKIDWSLENFVENRTKPEKVYFTFGKIPWLYLEKNGFHQKSDEEQWKMVLELKLQLENPSFYIAEIHGVTTLTLLPYGSKPRKYDDPVEVINEFFHQFTHQNAFAKEKLRILSGLQRKLRNWKNYLEKNSRRLRELEQDLNYKNLADLIMANLHAVPGGASSITLSDFYHDNHPVTIKLKANLSPQKNAESYYKKAKNQQLELTRMKDLISAKEIEINEVESLISTIESAEDLETLRNSAKQAGLENKRKEQSVSLPYFEFEHQGYRIWVGKNAQSNDLLTLKHSFKEDLWLHAKDVAGSHVVIKYQAGKKFPKDVIERAAQLAAYNSKRKTETLCPVIVTPKKFVRKRKGDPPGTVVVEREEVILVEPVK